MARNIIRIARGTKSKINSMHANSELELYEIVYATDTKEMGIINADNSITWLSENPDIEIPELELITSGAGNAITSISVDDHTINVIKGDTFLTEHQDISGKVDDTFTIGDLNLKNNITKAQLTSQINTATNSIKGLMSAQDKENLDNLMDILTNGSEDFVDTLSEILEIFENYPEGVNLLSKLNQIESSVATKVDANANITAGTHPKITYDAKGLVTGGEALVAGDIPNLPASKITSGTLPVNRGGTGAGTFSSGQVLIGNGTGQITTRSRSGIDSRTVFPPAEHTHLWSDITDAPSLAPYFKRDGSVKATGNFDLDGNNIINVEIDGGDL